MLQLVVKIGNSQCATSLVISRLSVANLDDKLKEPLIKSVIGISQLSCHEVSTYHCLSLCKLDDKLNHIGHYALRSLVTLAESRQVIAVDARVSRSRDRTLGSVDASPRRDSIRNWMCPDEL